MQRIKLNISPAPTGTVRRAYLVPGTHLVMVGGVAPKSISTANNAHLEAVIFEAYVGFQVVFFRFWIMSKSDEHRHKTESGVTFYHSITEDALTSVKVTTDKMFLSSLPRTVLFCFFRKNVLVRYVHGFVHNGRFGQIWGASFVITRSLLDYSTQTSKEN